MIGDIGLTELAVIAFVAILMFGPDKIPELGKQAGAILRKMRDFATAARDELRTELGEDYADLELRDLDPRTIARKHIAEAMNDAGSDTDARRRGHHPLGVGERTPYDVDAT